MREQGSECRGEGMLVGRRRRGALLGKPSGEDWEVLLLNNAARGVERGSELTLRASSFRRGAGVLSRRGGVRRKGEGERVCRGRGHGSSSLSDELESETMRGMSVLLESYREGARARGRLERRGRRGGVEE